MSQIQLTNRERVQGLERLGYGEREAAFLCLAALHGGYFLRRQYAQFLGKALGGTAATLIEKVLAKGHAKGTTYATQTSIYHLCARPFYASLGQEDNRNRRLREPASIKRKLMGLDFVLAHPDMEYLATEQEKVAYFTRTLQLDPLLLPTKRYASQGRTTERYFVEKFPISLSPGLQQAASSVVSFCFVDEGAVGLDGFETFLQGYRILLTNLPAFRVVYVASRETHFQAAAQAFAHCFDQGLEPGQTPADAEFIQHLAAHFEARRLYETRQWSSFDRAKLIRFRDDRQQFSGPKFEALYTKWKSDGQGGLEAVLTRETPSPAPRNGSFSTYRLEQNYEFFGNIAA